MPSPGNAERSQGGSCAAIDHGFRGAFRRDHCGGDAITVIAENRAYIRDVLATVLT